MRQIGIHVFFSEYSQDQSFSYELLVDSADALISSIGLKVDNPQVLQLTFQQIKGNFYLSIFRQIAPLHELTSMTMVLILKTLLRPYRPMAEKMSFLTISRRMQ
jgi:hypothetical protein